ncbi:hypothetical protein BJ138DRAFT_538137 [Hygrophoropsis aurantiaca]|uniref:Uncharacterized protein n=1 Tax=Hygrophoropsis aurantiaca TaxID=72124 RepID=A0ACB8AKE8_9AGAM|nr:hypothetical protein BJ138DRAFT_538137 [Hygrophoropsis aurantiaca]
MIILDPKQARKESTLECRPNPGIPEDLLLATAPVEEQAPDTPPPYYTYEGDSLGASVSPLHTSDFSTIKVLKSIHVEKFRGPISGTYCIDPDVTGDDHVQAENYSSDGNTGLRLGKSTGHFSSPNALFRARHGAISLHLSAKGSSVQRDRTSIDVANRHGDISLSFEPLLSGKNLNLSVYTRRGKIMVLLPRNFCGDIQISNRKRGGYDILPGLASRIRNMKGQSRKTILHVGNGNGPSVNDLVDAVTDHCQITSRSGKIIVGLSGEDVIPNRQGDDNLWKKLGGYFRGSSAYRSV